MYFIVFYTNKCLVDLYISYMISIYYLSGFCNNDGFYYNDANSFTICSNGIATVQRCAPYTANSGNSYYTTGSAYSYGDFCNVNLNDKRVG